MAKRGRDADAAGPTSIVTPLPLGELLPEA